MTAQGGPPDIVALRAFFENPTREGWAAYKVEREAAGQDPYPPCVEGAALERIRSSQDAP